MTDKADELLRKMTQHQVPMAPDKPYTPPEDVIENVMHRHGSTREKAIRELRKTGHY